VADDKLTRELNNRFVERTEIRPNRIVFHNGDEMEELLGIGTQLKEQKVVDNRPRAVAAEMPPTIPVIPSVPSVPTTPPGESNPSQDPATVAKLETLS